MAGADIHGSKCVTTHFGKKEDQVGTLIMTIEDIKTKIGLVKPGKWLESGLLECGSMAFKLKVFPNGLKEVDDGERVSMEVQVMKHGKTKWKRIERFIAKNADGIFLQTHTNLLDLESLKKDKTFVNGVRVPSLISHDTILDEENSSFFPNGVLTVKVNITVHGEEIVTYKTTKVPDDSISPFQLKGELSGHLRKMLESHRFSDFRIICQEEIIPCHRNIIAARSDVLEAMFEHNMEESKTGEVVIKDFDIDIVKAVVAHIYTGEVELTEDNTEELIRAADKYHLEGLKKKTEDALVKTVQIENAIAMFVLGDAVHANKLRDVSKEIIVSNAVAIVKINGWKAALGRFPELTLEIFESVVNDKERIN